MSDVWVSTRLREAGNIIAGGGHSCAARHVDGLLFALADRAGEIEREGLNPLKDLSLDMVFAHATVFAAGVVEEVSNGAV